MKHRLFLQSIVCILTFSALGTTLLSQSVSAAPAISINPKSGAPGTKVTIAGSNFASYVGDSLKVFFNDTEIPKTALSVPLSGSFQVVFEVPESIQPGDAIVSIRGVVGNILAEEVFTVPAPELRLSTWGGTILTTVQASVRGFQAGEPVNFSYYRGGGILHLGSQTTGETGECNLLFTIPESPRGKHSVIARNQNGQYATAEFEIISKIIIEPQTVAAGDNVIVSGTGFNADSEISIDLYDREVAKIQATKYGSFNTKFTVPVMKAGKYLVAVEDVSREVKWGEIVITSRISLSKSAGEVGAKLTLAGTGFEVRSTVNIKYDAQESLILKTDDIGAFTSTFTVPISNTGAHIITATDGINLRQAVYTVESEAPTPPEPLSPKQYAVITAPITFDWEGVYDVSQPLFYTLQVAHTPDFLHPILEKSDLIPSQCTLGNGETLLPNRRGTHYYWCVRAVDGASNIGEWSTPVAFRVKPVDILPAWMRYILIVIQVGITLVFGFRIWKATRNKGSES